MFDAELRKLKNRILKGLFSPNTLNADTVTAFGFLLGIVSMIYLYYGNSLFGTIFFLLNRAFDVLDGFFAQAKEKKDKELGSFLDIVADYVVYLGVPIIVGWAYPDLLFHFLFLVSLFTFNLLLWTYPQLIRPIPHIISQRYPTSLVEGVETTILYVMIIWRPETVLVFISLMVLTVAHRFAQGYLHLKAGEFS
ncbi:MAG: CDP-alcohol phosphatidyltransferase family protein [Methanobacteriota archaeon]|nr:MAG: CDP-alcohol phosphatidyltransferase family protein [Euryarchaeota archaeon]